MYNNAKNCVLGKFLPRNRAHKNSFLVMQLQMMLQKALDSMHLNKTDLSVEYAKICERNLYRQISIEEHREYQNWLRKLEDLDHLKRTRIFSKV